MVCQNCHHPPISTEPPRKAEEGSQLNPVAQAGTQQVTLGRWGEWPCTLGLNPRPCRSCGEGAKLKTTYCLETPTL